MRHFAIVLICALFAYCRSDTFNKDSINLFDENFKYAISSLQDSLRRSIGTNSNYILEVGRSFDDIWFSKLDSLGKRAGNIETKFVFSEDQKEFFIKGKVGSIYFDSQRNLYSLKLFAFKQGNETIWLLMSDKKPTDEIAKNGTFLFSKDNRYYFVGNAW